MFYFFDRDKYAAASRMPRYTHIRSLFGSPGAKSPRTLKCRVTDGWMTRIRFVNVFLMVASVILEALITS